VCCSLLEKFRVTCHYLLHCLIMILDAYVTKNSDCTFCQKISSKYVTKSLHALWLFCYFITNLMKSMLLNVPNGVLDTTFSCTSRVFPNTSVYSNNTTDRHGITEILLRVTLNTHNPNAIRIGLARCMRMLYRVHPAKEIKLYWWLSR
jgi:hypothetical protein